MATNFETSDQYFPAFDQATAGVPEPVRALAHDLRTPLTSLQSCLNLVVNGQAGPVTDDQLHFLGLARRNIDRLDRMVEGMLAAAVQPAGTSAPRRREIDLGPLLSETIAMHALTAAERGLDVDAEGIPESFLACVDPDVVVRILENVLGNALKFTPRGGLVRVWLEAGAGTPRSLAARLARRFSLPLGTFNLIVEDNGPGLSPAVQRRIFEPFNPGPRDLGVPQPGSGLGLSITRRLAESQGGEVRLASLPGRGTTVWLKLPRDPASDRFQRDVAQLQDTLCAGADLGPVPLVGILDIRPAAVSAAGGREGLLEFFGRGGNGGQPGWELYPGFWAAAVVDPVNWNRRWTLHSSRQGTCLEATRWQFIEAGNGEPWAATDPLRKPHETMVNPAALGPIEKSANHGYRLDALEDA